jgi:predicted DNA-binding protein (MmcQ/YjbR family)
MQFSILAAYCSKLPNARAERKWGNTEVFMLEKKMFALFIMDERDRRIEMWCKVEDDVFLSYTDQPGIRPAPYLARAKWVAMEKHAMTNAMARQVLNRAHQLVLAKLPKRVQAELQGKPRQRKA